MARDVLYGFDKTTLIRYEIGEVCADFNNSFVIDGTKDTANRIVINFDSNEILPNTIVYHPSTDSWWVVSHDKVERYQNENNEPMYYHNLELDGAIELLNARDLTDCGFNSNRYTIDSFIYRLFKLSNFEFATSDIVIETANNLTLNKVVDYIKTFENYSLLTALREFLDGYNCVAKLSFTTKEEFYQTVLDKAVITIVSKTGNYNARKWQYNDFNDVRETKNIDKNNYGTSVISNAENVVSTKTKTYPSLGGVRVSTTNGEAANGNNAILRLPTNIFRVNYIDIFNTHVPVKVYINNGSGLITETTIGYYDVSNEASVASIKSKIESTYGISVSEKALTKFKLRVYYNDNYNAVNKIFNGSTIECNTNLHTRTQFALCGDELASNVDDTDRVVYFKRGNDYIGHFNIFNRGANHNTAEFYIDQSDSIIYDNTIGGFHTIIYVGDGNNGVPSSVQYFDIKYTAFSVNFVPMTDLKIKYDNDGDTIDSQMYNQNGKLIDSNALSKLLLSYSKEIESDTITKFVDYYVGYDTDNDIYYGTLPMVGDIVQIANNDYIINNVSLDYTQHESDDDNINYYVSAEITMSKNVATKSLITNPNTNVRDYGIPQNNNVKRKQLYRDFYELAYSKETQSSYKYFDLDNVLNIGNEPKYLQEHIAVIKTHFTNDVNGSKDYYYQLETTTYLLKKAVYEVVDFKDNNIIGYGYQNLWSGFDISKILSGADAMVDLYSIPISYVDTNGEIEDITMRLVDIDTLKKAYDDYLDTTAYSATTISIYNASVFIPRAIYTSVESSSRDKITINAYGYEKDALEVPVFEYSCQVDDSEEISVGENILYHGNNDVAYMYSYAITDMNINDNNFTILKTMGLIPAISVDNNNVATSNYGVSMEYGTDSIGDYIDIALYSNQEYNINDNSFSGTRINLSTLDLTNKNIAISRTTLTENDLYHKTSGVLYSLSVESTLPTASFAYNGKTIVLDNDNYYICKNDAESVSGALITTSVDTLYYIGQPSGTPSSAEIGKYKAIKHLVNPTYGSLYNTTLYDDSSLPNVQASYVGYFIAALSTTQLDDTGYFDYSYSGNTLTYTIGGNNYTSTNTTATITLRYDTSAHDENIGSDSAQVNNGGSGSVSFTDSRLTSSNFNYSIYRVRARKASGGWVNVTSSANVNITATPFDSSTHTITIYFNAFHSDVSYIYLEITFDFEIHFNATYNNRISFVAEGSRDSGQQTYTLGVYDTITAVEGISYSTIVPPTIRENYLYVCVGQNAWSNTDVKLSSISSNSNTFRYNNKNWYWNGNAWAEYNQYEYKLLYAGNNYWVVYDLNTTDKYIFGNLCYSWSDTAHNWYNSTVYSWELKGSATNKFFTYGNGLYQYDSINNKFVYVDNSLNNRVVDLMFVLNNANEITIVDNKFRIYINHYLLK